MNPKVVLVQMLKVSLFPFFFLIWKVSTAQNKFWLAYKQKKNDDENKRKKFKTAKIIGKNNKSNNHKWDFNKYQTWNNYK